MNDRTDPRPTGQDERLARLAARSAAARGASPGTPFPPPSPQDRAGRPTRATRRHPAKGSRSAALTLSVMTTLGLTGFFKVQAEDTTSATAATISGSSVTASTTAATSNTATADATAATDTTATTAATTQDTAATTTAAATTSTTDLADGTYVGETDTNKWGPVQVQIVVSGGTITEVDVLQYPDENDKDVAINSRALPTLIQETLTAQSADVDSVSGATYTSDSYKVSLQSAIDQARAAASAS